MESIKMVLLVSGRSVKCKRNLELEDREKLEQKLLELLQLIE